MEFETLELEREGPVLRVWLNRPKRLNAISQRMLLEIGDLFQSLQTDFETRVVVLGGRGRSFCAGADRKGDEPALTSSEPSDREVRWYAQLGHRACRAIEDCEILTVARVHGHAVGGGACFSLSCDFRVFADDALWRVPEVALGIPLSWAAVPRMIHEVGAARAREILLLCEDVPADRALHWGIAHRVSPAAELDDALGALVDTLLDQPELAVHMTKTQLRGYARRASLGDATEADSDLIAVAGRSSAMRERFRMG